MNMQLHEWKECTVAIRADFHNEVPDVVTVLWGAKLLSGLDTKKSKEESLPIVLTYGSKEQFIAVPRLESSVESQQAHAVWSEIMNWNLEEKVQILCYTIATNTGCINDVYVLEQKLREILVFACCHHVYELVLKRVKLK